MGGAEQRSGAGWFWATVAAAGLPLGVAAVLLLPWGPRSGGAGDLMPLAAALACIVLLALARSLASASRRVAATSRWLGLLRHVEGADWPAGHRARVRRLGLEGRVTLCTLPLIGAWAVGLRRPRIVVTAGLLEALGPEEFEAVLRHEAHHLRCHHPLGALVTGALCDGFGWFPAVRPTAQAWLLAREFAADAEAAAHLGSAVLRSALLRCGGAPAVGVAGTPAFTDLARLRVARLEGSVPARVPLPVGPWLGSLLLAAMGTALAVAVCGLPRP